MPFAVVCAEFTAHYKRTMLGFLRKNAAHGQSLFEYPLIRRSDLEFERDRMLALLHGPERPDAVLALCFRPDTATLEAYREAGVPLVILDEATEGASTVACDNFEGGLLAGRHLVRAGRRSPALVCGRTGAGTEGDYNAVLRRRGFEKALAEAGLTLSPERVIQVSDYSRRDGVNAMTTLLDQRQRFDAVFCAAGDAAATGMLAVARERGVRIPEDVAVLGFDDMPLASIAEPPLTTIRQPLEAIAREALRLLTEERAAIVAKPRTVLLKPALVERASA